MRRSISLLIVSVLLVHWPDQLSDSYLAPFGVQAAPSGPSEQQAGPRVGLESAKQNQSSSSERQHSNTPHQDKQHQRGFRPNPATRLSSSDEPKGLRKEALLSAGQLHETDKLLLLTDGRELKLFPLNGDDLSPSGGFYLIKPTNFNLSDQRVVDSLAPNRRYLNWLQHSQTLSKTSGRQRASILPPKKKSDGSHETSLSEEDLYTSQSGWRKPLISSVGHFFDSRFCDHQSFGGENVDQLEARRTKQLLDTLSGPLDCLVIYWLDKANNAFHLGALELNSTNKLRLLNTNFDSRGVSSASRSNTGENVLELRQFAPLDLCQEAAPEPVGSCQSIGVHVESRSLKLHAALTQNDNSTKAGGRLFSARLEPVPLSGPAAALKLTLKAVAQSDEFFDALKVNSRSVKNLIERSDSSSQLLFLDGKPGSSTKIAAIDLELAEGGSEGALMSELPTSYKRASSVLDVQWETTKLKVRRSKGNKLDEPFSVVSMRLSSQCGLVWLTSDNELYALELDQTRAGASRFLGKLSAKRPLIRTPITEMRLHRDSLFFTDSTRRSLMALKLTQVADAPQSRHEQPLDLALTHRVLLVEMLPIQDFELVVLPGDEQSNSKTSDQCAALSEPQWRHGQASNQRHSAAHSQPKEANSAPVGLDLVTGAQEDAEALVDQATVVSAPLDDDDADADYDEFNFNKCQMALVICLLVSVILLLACINYILWRQRSILVAAQAIEIGHTTHSYQVDEKPIKQ